MRLTQDEWNTIFDYCFGAVLALAYLGLSRWLDISWWIIAPFVSCQLGGWYRRHLRQSPSTHRRE